MTTQLGAVVRLADVELDTYYVFCIFVFAVCLFIWLVDGFSILDFSCPDFYTVIHLFLYGHSSQRRVAQEKYFFCRMHCSMELVWISANFFFNRFFFLPVHSPATFVYHFFCVQRLIIPGMGCFKFVYTDEFISCNYLVNCLCGGGARCFFCQKRGFFSVSLRHC